jgi:hypothetical protein
MYIQMWYNYWWNSEKSKWLKETRGVSFEEIIHTDLVATPKNARRLNQTLLLFNHENYIWVVPCVPHGDELFLKTLYRSRVYTRMWERGELK